MASLVYESFERSSIVSSFAPQEWRSKSVLLQSHYGLHLWNTTQVVHSTHRRQLDDFGGFVSSYPLSHSSSCTQAALNENEVLIAVRRVLANDWVRFLLHNSNDHTVTPPYMYPAVSTCAHPY